MSIRDGYLAYARGQAAGVSPTYEALARAVVEDEAVSALLARLPRPKQQPNLLFGVARHLGGPVHSPAEFCAWVVERWADVRPELLARTTQTNEAGRCATLLPVLAGMPGPLDLPGLAAQAPPEATLVIFHTAVLAYVEPAVRRRFADVVRGLPGHWIANEHPTLLEGLVEGPFTQPRTDGPDSFLTALDGIPVGWSGPHGQSCD